MAVLYEEHLPAQNYQDALELLGESRETRENCLAEVNVWLDENPQINANRDVVFLLHFLRGAKFRMDKAKKRIETFYKMRAERVEWFENRKPFATELAEILDLGLFLPVEKKDKNNCQIFIIRTGVHNTRIHQQNDVLKVMKMVLDVALHLDETVSIYGCIAIFDMKGVTLQHGLQMTPTIIKRAVHCWENYSCKVKSLEFVNAPFHINVVLDTFRMFMSEKLRNRITVTRGKSSIDAELPKELGGDGSSYKELTKYWKKKTEEHAAWFDEQDKYKTIL